MMGKKDENKDSPWSHKKYSKSQYRERYVSRSIVELD
jgi:hypothetical protein